MTSHIDALDNYQELFDPAWSRGAEVRLYNGGSLRVRLLALARSLSGRGTLPVKGYV